MSSMRQLDVHRHHFLVHQRKRHALGLRFAGPGFALGEVGVNLFLQ